ncbi:MAG: HEPN domain-containing protein [Aliarcobacter butzleri]|nr:HEPN domain-containing protein [Aliarcobacter butzleri]
MDKRNFKYEVLLIINKKNQSALFNLCDDNKSFLKILEKEKIKHHSDKLEFKEKKYLYNLKTNLIQNKEERYFHLEIKHESEEELKNYTNFLRELKRIFNEHNFYVEILRNDLYLYYSEKAYILINKVENHMRKFIKYFLITKVGINWIKETTSKEIEKSINDYENRDIEDELNRLDFIQLGYFLFNEYSKKDISLLQKLINEKKQINDELLKEFIQISNWEKYFKQNIKCENNYLKSRWEELYKLRNDVAHNKNFTEHKLNEVTKLYNEINEKLGEAFKNIDKITTIDKDEVLSNFDEIDFSPSFLREAIILAEQSKYQKNKNIYETIYPTFADIIANTPNIANIANIAIAMNKNIYRPYYRGYPNKTLEDKDILR